MRITQDPMFRERIRLRRLLRRGVTYVGTLGLVSHERFVDIVTRWQGTYVPFASHARPAVVVIGSGDLPVNSSGDPLRFVASTPPDKPVRIDEGRFLDLFDAEHDHEGLLYTLPQLAEVLQVSTRKLSAWVDAGLIRSRTDTSDLPRFDLRQASVARTLVNLTAAGVSTARLRQTLLKLRRWIGVEEPLQQLAVLDGYDAIRVRLHTGELADSDGQLHMEFAEPLPSRSLSLGNDVSASINTHELAVELELAGNWRQAEAGYHRALLEHGPNAQISFDLAHLLAQRGEIDRAVERYRAAIELQPDFADAWNNLGLLLADLRDYDSAVAALRRAAALSPADADIRYNLHAILAEAKRSLRPEVRE
jgi:tetratricopeptide (TPR) repeat protein